MNNQARVYTQGWHYVIEGLIICYFVLMWERFSHVNLMPYWSYFVVFIPSIVLFSVLTYYNLHPVFFTIVLAGMSFGFYFMKFPLSIALLFAFLLTYRYYRIDRAENFHKELTYFGVTTLVACFSYYWMREPSIFSLLFFQYCVIVIGYYTRSILFVPTKEERKAYARPFTTIVSLVGGYGLLLTLLYQGVLSRIFQVIWQGILFFVVNISSFTAYLFNAVPTGVIETPVEGEGEDDIGVYRSELGSSVTEALEEFAVVYLLLAIVIMAAFCYAIFRIIRRTSGKKEKHDETTTFQSTNEKAVNQPVVSIRNSIRSLFKKPEHPARKLVYDFEKRLAKTNYKREPYETVENWLQRISSGMELKVYQQVRYGMKDVSKDEITKLKRELRLLEDELVESSKKPSTN